MKYKDLNYHQRQDVDQEIALYRLEHPDTKMRNDWVVGNYTKSKRFNLFNKVPVDIEDIQLTCQQELRFIEIDYLKYLFSKISAEDRNLFVFSVMSDKTYEQIGKLLGVHRVTITRKIKEIKRKLSR